MDGDQAGESSLRPRGWGLTLGRGPPDGDKCSFACGIQGNFTTTANLSLLTLPHPTLSSERGLFHLLLNKPT